MTHSTGITPEIHSQQRLTIRRAFLRSIVKPARYLALQWPSYDQTGRSSELVALLSGGSYERKANDPFLAAIAEALTKPENFQLGRAFSFPTEALTKLSENGIGPFVAPQLTQLSSTALVVVALDQFHELGEISRQLSAADITLDVAARKNLSTPALIAVIKTTKTTALPSLLGKIFDRVYSLSEFEIAASDSSSAGELVSWTNPEEPSAQPKGSSRTFYPARPVAPLTEVSYERARISLCSVVSGSASSVGQEIGAALRESGQTEFQLEHCKELLASPSSVELGDLLATVNLGLPSSITGVTLSQVSAQQISSRLLEAFKRFRRARLELETPTLSISSARYLGVSQATVTNILQVAQSIFSAPDVHCKLTVEIGHPIDSQIEIDETVEFLRNLMRVVDRKRGLKIRFVRYNPNPAGKQSDDAQISSAETLARYQSIIGAAKFKGISFSLADQFPELFSLALSRNLWSSANHLSEFCAQRKTDSASWLDLLDSQTELSSVFSALNNSDESQGIRQSQSDSDAVNKEQLAADQLDGSMSDQQNFNLAESTSAVYSPAKPSSSGFGRSGKRSAKQTIAPPTMGRVRFTWSKSGPARFLSHLDNLRTIESALRRSELNVTYTQGQKPRIKISFGPPLPVGYTSDCELFDLFFETAPNAEELTHTLNSSLPDGFRIIAAESIYTKAPSALEEIQAADYLIALENTSLGAVQEILHKIVASESLDFVRQRKSGEKTLNLRAGLFAAEVVDESQLLTEISESNGPVIIKLSLALTDTFYVRPEEFLRASGLIDDNNPAALISRVRLHTIKQRALPALVKQAN